VLSSCRASSRAMPSPSREDDTKTAGFAICSLGMPEVDVAKSSSNDLTSG
jgi:hypothetical protein